MVWAQIFIPALEQCESQISASQELLTLGTCIKHLPFQLYHIERVLGVTSV